MNYFNGEKIIFCIFSFIFSISAFCSDEIFETKKVNEIPSLRIKVIDRLFNFKKDPLQKIITNNHLRKNRINLNELKFECLTLKNLDFSEMYLRNIDFTKCKFENVNLKNADLTNAKFDKAIFNNVQLEGAILYCPLNNLGDRISKKTLIIKEVSNPLNLVEQYSHLMKKFDESQEDYLLEQAKSLNQLLGLLKVNLKDQSLRGLNLTNLTFKNFNLENTDLQEVILSKNVKVASCAIGNHTIFFNSWCFGDDEHQEAYQRLVNAKFNIFLGVDQSNLLKGIQLKKDLRNAYLRHITLKGADLANANLKGADLFSAELKKANLTGTILKNTNLENAFLQGATLSKNVKVPHYLQSDCTGLFDSWCFGDEEHQRVYQPLVNAKFNLFIGVDRARLLQGMSSKKDLRCANLEKIDLQEADLRKANLQYANLKSTKLIKADLSDSNLQYANLRYTNLSESKLAGVRLQNADLFGTDLQDSILVNAQLQNASLIAVKLGGSDMTGVNVSKLKLSSDFTLPKNCSDELLHWSYENCKDNLVKITLKQILQAKKIPIF